MEVFALGLKLKEEGASTVKASVDKMRAAMAGATQSAKGLDTGVGALSGAFTKLAAVVGVGAIFTKFITETSTAQFAQAQLASALKSTGGAAGQSLAALNAHAGALQNVTVFGDDAINAAQGLLLTFTKIQGDVFPKATAAVLNVAQAMGTDLKSAAIQVGKALNDPIAGVNALARSGIQFTAQQKEQIKTLVESGQAVQAQTMILKELEAQFGGSAEAARNTLGGAIAGLKNAFGDLFEVSEQGTSGVVSGLNNVTNALVALNATITSSGVFAKIVREIGLAAAGARDAGTWFGLFGDQIDAVGRTLTGFSEIVRGVNALNRATIANGREMVRAAGAEFNAIGQRMTALREESHARESGTRAMSGFKSALDGLLAASRPLVTATEAVTAAGKSQLETLIALAGAAPITTSEFGKLSAAERVLDGLLKGGTLSIQDRITKGTQLTAVIGAINAATIKLSATEVRAGVEQRMAAGLSGAARGGRAAIVPAAVDSSRLKAFDLSKVIKPLTDIETELRGRIAEMQANLGMQLADGFARTLGDAIGGAFERFAATGSIGEGFKDFGRTMLAGLGGMLQTFGAAALAASKIMIKIMAAFKTLNPVLGAGAAIALIALGGALKGAAARSFGGGVSAGLGGGFVSVGSAGGAGSTTLPGLRFAPTASSTMAGGIGPTQPITVTIIGPNDPSAQRQMQELIEKANRRGNV